MHRSFQMNLIKKEERLKMGLILGGLPLTRTIVSVFLKYHSTNVSLKMFSACIISWLVLFPKITDTNGALHFYRPQNVITSSGSLKISTTLKDNRYKAFNETTKRFYADTKHIQSGMMQGWNKFCFTGGIVEFNAMLPGDPKIGGLWPALWMLGNLARATYAASSNNIWPFSYNMCDEKNEYSQRISACSHAAHYDLKEGQGRGAPEVDILEAMMGPDEKLQSTNITKPYISTSLQIAPGLGENRPIEGKLPKEVRSFL